MGLRYDPQAPASKGRLRQLAGLVELPLEQLGWTNSEADEVLTNSMATAEFRAVVAEWAKSRRPVSALLTAPSSRPRLLWEREIEIGQTNEVKTWQQLQVAVEAAGWNVTDRANELFPKVELSRTRSRIILVCTTVGDLGFTNWTPLKDIHASGLKLGWELCPNEAPAQAILQCPDVFEHGFWYRFMMKLIPDAIRYPRLFCARHASSGRRLANGSGGPGDMLEPDFRVVFACKSQV